MSDKFIPDPPHGGDTPPDLAQLHLDRKLWLARLALMWERTWPALWPATGIAGAFVALALFDVLPRLPVWLHGLILAAFLAALGFALWRGLHTLRFPGVAPARRRIERESGLAHRPLVLVKDDIAGGRDDPQSRALWALHRKRTLERIRALRVGIPAPGLARLDPWAVRGILIVVLAIGIVTAWGDGFNRIARALSPGVGGAGRGPAVVDVWITPPAYTGLAPIFLSAGKGNATAGNPTLVSASGTGKDQPQPAIGGTPATGAPISIPEGSTILAQLSGGWGKPALAIGDGTTAFKSVADGTWKVNATVRPAAGADRLVIRQGTGRVASWPIHIRPDHPPTIRFADAPGQSARNALRVTIDGEDDYGITKAKLYIRRARVDFDTDGDAEEEAALAKFNAPQVIDLTLPGSGARTVHESSYHDLTASPWAGMRVTLQVVAWDGAGQPAVTAPVTVTLPERYFRNPMARVLVLLRKKLILDPGTAEDVADDLDNFATIPQAFNNDKVVFLAITTAANRLRDDSGLAAIEEVQKLLWNTALHLEDGELSLAEQRMRDIQKRLMDALNRKDNPEVQKLMRELQQAMSEFLKEMMKRMPKMAQQPFDPNAQMLTPQDLQRMLDRAEQLAQTGNLDAARQMLSMLRDLLENLRSGRFAQNQGRQGQQAMKMLRDLQDLMKRQQELMDQTFRQSQEGMRNGRPQTGEGAQRQQELQRRLQDLLRRFGEMQGRVPKSLGDAELAMRDAEGKLRKNQPGQAVPPQGRALEDMQKGAGQMLQQFMRQYGQGRGRGPGRGQGRLRAGRMPMNLDPLGRPVPSMGQSSDDSVKIPDISDTQRARKILEELRRRAGELGRPQIEMDYIERLLRQF